MKKVLAFSNADSVCAELYGKIAAQANGNLDNCNGFSLVTMLGLLRQYGSEIEAISSEIFDHSPSPEDPNDIYPEHIKEKLGFDPDWVGNLDDFNISFEDFLPILNKLGDYVVIRYKKKNIDMGHQISLRREGSQYRYYCNSKKSIQNKIKARKAEVGILKSPKGVFNELSSLNSGLERIDFYAVTRRVSVSNMFSERDVSEKLYNILTTYSYLCSSVALLGALGKLYECVDRIVDIAEASQDYIKTGAYLKHASALYPKEIQDAFGVHVREVRDIEVVDSNSIQTFFNAIRNCYSPMILTFDYHTTDLGHEVGLVPQKDGFFRLHCSNLEEWRSTVKAGVSDPGVLIPNHLLETKIGPYLSAEKAVSYCSVFKVVPQEFSKRREGHAGDSPAFKKVCREVLS